MRTMAKLDVFAVIVALSLLGTSAAASDSRFAQCTLPEYRQTLDAFEESRIAAAKKRAEFGGYYEHHRNNSIRAAFIIAEIPSVARATTTPHAKHDYAIKRNLQDAPDFVDLTERGIAAQPAEAEAILAKARSIEASISDRLNRNLESYTTLADGAHKLAAARTRMLVWQRAELYLRRSINYKLQECRDRLGIPIQATGR